MRKAVDSGNTLGEPIRTIAKKRHQLTLKARESLSIEGVVGVESFDDQEVVVETDQGVLLIKGDGLHIKELNLDSGALHVDGSVRVLEYAGDSLGKRSKGVLAKLFK
jgi:sporulation protein YabP